jgi:predicted MFS family arabinose efflux permease
MLSAYFGGYTLITISAVFWLHRFRRRPVAITSAIVFIAGLLAAASNEAFAVVMAAMIGAGAGAGMLYGLFVAIIAESDEPERNFGFALASQLALGSVMLFLGPAVLGPRWGLAGILLGTAVFVVVICCCIPWIPEPAGDAGDQQPSDDRTAPQTPVFAGIVALLLWFTGYSGIYALVERIGVDGGLDGMTIGAVLSATLVTGIGGAMSAALISDRFGHKRPHLVGMAGTLVALILLSGRPGLAGYSVAVGFLTFSWNFWLAYLLGTIASADFQRRYAVLTTAALGLGATIGPGLAGGLVTGNQFQPIFILAGITISLGLVIILWVLSSLQNYNAREVPGAAQPVELK